MTPDTLSRLTLSNLPKHFRQIALWFTITLLVGYSTGLVFVMNTTSLTPKGVEERYRGNQSDPAAGAPSAEGGGLLGDTSATTSPLEAPAEGASAEEPEMKFEKSLPEMLNITHTHILAMTSFLVLAAAIFALSSRVSGRWKSFLIVEPFIAILTSFAAMWLMRYVHPSFSYLLVLSSASFAVCLYVMMGVSIVELMGRGRGKG